MLISFKNELKTMTLRHHLILRTYPQGFRDASCIDLYEASKNPTITNITKNG